MPKFCIHSSAGRYQRIKWLAEMLWPLQTAAPADVRKNRTYEHVETADVTLKRGVSIELLYRALSTELLPGRRLSYDAAHGFTV